MRSRDRAQAHSVPGSQVRAIASSRVQAGCRAPVSVPPTCDAQRGFDMVGLGVLGIHQLRHAEQVDPSRHHQSGRRQIIAEGFQGLAFPCRGSRSWC
jgi:hypothetical protein